MIGDLWRFLQHIWRPGDVREVRIPGKPRTASGYFDDPEALAATVARYDGKSNLYVTVNPVNPALLARAINRIKDDARSTTSDADVVKRRFLPIDIDPVRPSGISATDDEQGLAHDLTEDVTNYLRNEGWPEPLMAMSGNGFLLLYPIDLPNDTASTALVVGVLAHLATRFDTPEVHIDTTMSNASRIVALVGTMKVKGDPTPDRPHRRSALVSSPDELVSVPIERLRALLPNTSREDPRPERDRMLRGWVRDLLDAKGVGYRERIRSGTTWYLLDQCPFHPEDDIQGDCGVGEESGGKALGNCFHNRGAGMGWRDFKSALGLDSAKSGNGAGYSGTRPDPRPAPRNVGSSLPPPDVDDWVIEGILRPGAILIVASPEGLGKSYIRKEMAVRLTTCQGSLFGHYPVPRSYTVLEIDEENGEAEEFRREEQVFAALGVGRGDATNYWSASFPALDLGDEGARQYLREQILGIRPGVLMLDTGTSMVGEEWGPEFKAAMRFLRSLAVEFGCAVVIFVHFVKPGRGRDRPTRTHGTAMADVMGQWPRLADAVALLADLGDGRANWSMFKKVPKSELVIAQSGGLWTVVHVGAERRVSTDDRVLRAIAAGGANPDEIGDALGVSKRTVSASIRRLRQAGFLEKSYPYKLTDGGREALP